MTRNEALNIIETNMNSGPTFILDVLEKLNLIKFDEEVKDSPQMIIRNNLGADGHYFQPMSKAGNIIDTLYKAGYKIVKV